MIIGSCVYKFGVMLTVPVRNNFTVKTKWRFYSFDSCTEGIKLGVAEVYCFTNVQLTDKFYSLYFYKALANVG